MVGTWTPRAWSRSLRAHFGRNRETSHNRPRPHWCRRLLLEGVYSEESGIKKMNRSSISLVGLCFVMISFLACVVLMQIPTATKERTQFFASLEAKGYTFQVVTINSPVFTIELNDLDIFLTRVNESPFPNTIFVRIAKEEQQTKLYSIVLYTFSPDLKIGYRYTR